MLELYLSSAYILLVILVLMVYKRRETSKIPGPLALPLIGRSSTFLFLFVFKTRKKNSIVSRTLIIAKKQLLILVLRGKCPYSELFWSVFSRILTECGEVRCISPYSVRMWENRTRITANTDTFYASECGYFHIRVARITCEIGFELTINVHFAEVIKTVDIVLLYLSLSMKQTLNFAQPSILFLVTLFRVGFLSTAYLMAS